MSLKSFQPLRVRFADVLLAIKAEIVARGVVPLTMVQVIASDTPPTTKAEKLVYIRPRRHSAAQDQVQSAGRIDTRLVRMIDVYVRSRSSSDKVDTNVDFLTTAGRASLDLEEDIINALQDFAPVDSSGNLLTVQPIRISTGTQPDMDAKRLGWGQSSSSWEILYMPPMSLVDILPASIAAAVAGTAYSRTFTISENEGAYVIGTASWAASANLPTGLSCNSSNGTITGTPTVAGKYVFVLTVTDQNSGLSGWRRYALPVSIGITGTPGAGTVGVACSVTLAAVGATGSVTWSLYPGSGALPTGLTLNASTGVLAGTPTATGVYTFKVLVKDSADNQGTQTYSVTVS